MVKSTSGSLKAKDIDNQRLQKRVDRLEKMVEINKNYDGPGRNQRHEAIPEREEVLEETQNFGIPDVTAMNHGGFGQNNLVQQVNQELLQHQIAGSKYKQSGYDSRAGSSKPRGGALNNMTREQQREWEEAMELDRILEEERRQQSVQVFAQAAESKYDRYLQGLDVPNIKNASSGMQGVFGMGDTGGDNRNNYQL